VVGGVAVEAVEEEEQGVEAGAEMQALLGVPGEGRAMVAEILGEGCEVSCAV